jgi:hypothetical protein
MNLMTMSVGKFKQPNVGGTRMKYVTAVLVSGRDWGKQKHLDKHLSQCHTLRQKKISRGVTWDRTRASAVYKMIQY